MDYIISLVNVATSYALATLCAWGILNPLVRDGIVIKIGLISTCFGHLLVAFHLWDGIQQADLLALNKARFVTNAGWLLVVLGYAVRHAKGERLHQMLPDLFGRRDHG